MGITKYPIHFDGWKCYFNIQNPTSTGLTKYPIIKIISSTTYEPQRRYSHRVYHTKIAVVQWRDQLGFSKIEVTKATLANNANMAQTLQAETMEYTRNRYNTRV